jgi:hypothetical protein
MVVFGVVLVRAGRVPPQGDRPMDQGTMDAIGGHPYPPHPPSDHPDDAGDDGD